MRSRALLLGALVGALASVAGCGIPLDSEPRAISAEDAGLATASSTTTPGKATGSRELVLFFVDPEPRLVEVDRQVEVAPDPALAVSELLAGVTDEERAQGLLSSIPPDTQLLSAQQADDVVAVDLSEEINTISGDNLIQAYAQIVYTATDFEGVAAVRFFVAGEPVDVPTAEGPNQGVVRRSDYRSLAPA